MIVLYLEDSMTPKLKPLFQQVIFITGASSGIGLATVGMAVQKGAKVFMVSRNEDELQRIQDDMRSKGFETAYAVADVAEYDQLQTAADSCIATFGRIDTWVNNAGITIYSKLMDTTEAEAKRLFDTNFWGMVNGCKAAVLAMGNTGGVLINIGSVLAKSVDSLQGVYTACEHAMKGYTDALREELRIDQIPIAVTLVLPGAVDTPFLHHARTDFEPPELTSPVSTPHEVASVILACAVKPTAQTGVGLFSFLSPIMARIIPYMRKGFKEARQAGCLFLPPAKEGEVRGHITENEVKKVSFLMASGLAVVGGTLLIFRTLKVMKRTGSNFISPF
jgi:short-subunit dehydrogenase